MARYASAVFFGGNILFINLVGPTKFTAIITFFMVLQLATCEAVFAHELSPGTRSTSNQ